jgi:two-component system, NtrC family, sensor kinase
MSIISRKTLPDGFIENLLQSTVDGVICSDIKGRILIFNQAAVDICGYTREEALNEINIRDLYPNNEGAKQVMKMLRSHEYGGPGKIHSCQIDLRRKDGDLVPIDLNASIVTEEGVEVATIGFFRDLRGTLKMQRELEETQMQLLHAEKLSSLGKLAAGVAHQLNNPLGGIVIYAGILLEEYELNDSARKDIERILRDAKRSHSIVRELLEFARPSRHQTALHDINLAISRTVFLLESQPIFQNIEIVKDFTEALPLVPGDRQQFNHLFMNLLLNAVEAMDDQGTLTIKTSHAADPGFISVTISDTGPGVPEALVSRIFEPFFTTKESGKGTGLGLSLAYSIVQDHDGKITVKNLPTGGASFAIMLPKSRGMARD